MTSRLKVVHQSTCYYHQDLQYRRLQLASRPTFCAHRHAILLVGASRLMVLVKLILKSVVLRRQCIGRELKCHPFSGLLSSAGLVVTHYLADVDFHDHRPAVFS